jgi:hypothetical protein
MYLDIVGDGKERSMERLSQSRLASSLTVILGAWIMISPIFISITGAALTSLLITGAVMIVFGIVQLAWENSLPSWVNALAAIWLFASAFTFTVSTAVMWNQVISAIVAFLLSTWDGVEMGEVHRMHHTHAV